MLTLFDMVMNVENGALVVVVVVEEPKAMVNQTKPKGIRKKREGDGIYGWKVWFPFEDGVVLMVHTEKLDDDEE